MITDYNKKQKRKSLKKNLYFVAGGILLLIVSGFLVFADFRIYNDKKKLDAKIQDYKNQIKEIEKKNQDLKHGISEAGNNDYIEKVAREELDLQKPGENVVGFIMPKTRAKEPAKPKSFWENWTGWLSQEWSLLFK